MKILSILLLTASTAFCQVEREVFPGSLFWEFGLGVGTHQSNVTAIEQEFSDTARLVFFTIDPNGDTINRSRVEYGYGNYSGDLALCSFVNSHIAVGGRYSFGIVNQLPSYSGFEERQFVLNNSIGPQLLWWMKSFDRIAFSSLLGLSYSFGTLDRYPIVNSEVPRDKLPAYVSDAKESVWYHGVKSRIGLRMHAFLFSGRFGIFVSGHYDYMIAGIADDQTDGYPGYIVANEFGFKVGGGYLTE